MFNSVFLFIMLLAFKHTHLISDLDVFPCIPLHLLSSCTFRAFFDKPPCPTSLNIVLYPSHWQPPPTVHRQKRQPPSPDEHLREFIASEHVDVLELERMSKEEAWTQSFRVLVTAPNPRCTLDSDFWPHGIGCRQYYRKRPNTRNTPDDTNM